MTDTRNILNFIESLKNRKNIFLIAFLLPVSVNIFLLLGPNIGNMSFYLSILIYYSASFINNKFFSVFFQNKLPKLLLSIPIKRETLFQEYFKIFKVIIVSLFISIFINFILFFSNGKEFLACTSTIVILISYYFYTALNPPPSTNIEVFIMFIKWLFSISTLFLPLYYIYTIFQEYNGYIMFIFSISIMVSFIFLTKRKLMNFSF